MRRIILLVSALLTLGAVAAVPVTTAPQAAAADCAKVSIVQARGSGQAYGEPTNIAALLAASVDRRARAAGLTTTVTEVQYPAVGGAGFGVAFVRGLNYLIDYYGNSVREGTRVAGATISEIARRCGTATRIVLVGYSQGAHVVGDAFQALEATLKPRVSAVVMIADPRRTGGTGNSIGNTSHFHGIATGLGWTPRTLSYSEKPVVRSYCAVGDSICAFDNTQGTILDGLTGATSIHTSYGQRESEAFRVLTIPADKFGADRLGVPSPPALTVAALQRVVGVPGGARYFVDALGRHPLPDLIAERCRAAGNPINEHAAVETTFGLASPVRCEDNAQLIRAVQNLVVRFPHGSVLHFANGKHQAVGGASAIACLQLRGKTVVSTADPGYETALRFSTPVIYGDLTCGSTSVMGNRIARHVAGDAYVVDRGGLRHWIPDQLTWMCRTRQGMPVVNTDRTDLIQAIPEGGWDRCPQNLLLQVLSGKVLRHTDGDAHTVDAAGQRHWIPDVLTWQCRTRIADVVVETRLRDSVNAIPAGGWAFCDSPDWLRQNLANSIVRHESGAAYQVDSAGVRHHIPNSVVYGCAVQETPRVTTTRMWENITALTEGGPAACPAGGPLSWRGKMVRLAEGDSHYVDSAGVRHWVPDTVTWDCRRIMGTAVVEGVDRASLAALPEGGWDNCPDVGALRQAVSGKVLRHSDGDMHYVDGGGTRHWIPDGLTAECRLQRWGAPQIDTVRRNYVDALAAGAWDDCGDMNWIKQRLDRKLVRHSDGDVHYVRDGVRHWVPDQLTYDCNRQRWGLAQVETLRRNYITDIPEGAWDDCGDMAWVRSYLRGKILRHDAGDAHYIDGNGVRHWIPNGTVYQCFIGRGVPVVQTRVRHYVNDIPEGDWARCP